jgi:hypothetical protein
MKILDSTIKMRKFTARTGKTASAVRNKGGDENSTQYNKKLLISLRMRKGHSDSIGRLKERK